MQIAGFAIEAAARRTLAAPSYCTASNLGRPETNMGMHTRDHLRVLHLKTGDTHESSSGICTSLSLHRSSAVMRTYVLAPLMRSDE